MSRKGAKSRTGGRKLRSNGTKAKARVGHKRASSSGLEKKLAEALEREAATSEVLRVISSSPGELESVFQAMLANAIRSVRANSAYFFGGKEMRFAQLLNKARRSVMQNGGSRWLFVIIQVCRSPASPEQKM